MVEEGGRRGVVVEGLEWPFPFLPVSAGVYLT